MQVIWLRIVLQCSGWTFPDDTDLRPGALTEPIRRRGDPTGLAAQARLFGMSPAAVECCSV